MEKEPIIIEKYGVKVYANPTTEALRPLECLCLNCNKQKNDPKENCEVAFKLFNICVEHNIALAVTRCPIDMFEQRK